MVVPLSYRLEQGINGFIQAKVPFLVRNSHIGPAQKIAQKLNVHLIRGILDWSSKLGDDTRERLFARYGCTSRLDCLEIRTPDIEK